MKLFSKGRKKLLIFASLIVSVLSITFSSPKKVNAWQYNTYSTRNIYGVSYQKYWASGTLTNWQKQQINHQMYRWNSSNNTGVWTKIQVTITPNKSQSIIDYYYDKRGYYADGIPAITLHKINDRRVNWTRQNWGCAEIIALGRLYNDMVGWKKIQAWAHETGHAFGLEHNDDPYYPSVMRSNLDWSDRAYDGPTYNDLMGINYLYR